MAQHGAVVAVYAKHDAAEVAVRKVAEAGLDMKHFSIVGKGYDSEEQVIGFYSVGDRIRLAYPNIGHLGWTAPATQDLGADTGSMACPAARDAGTIRPNTTA